MWGGPRAFRLDEILEELAKLGFYPSLHRSRDRDVIEWGARPFATSRDEDGFEYLDEASDGLVAATPVEAAAQCLLAALRGNV